MKKSKIQILEGLLRLRQAACHPRLIDKAKAVGRIELQLDVLLPQLLAGREGTRPWCSPSSRACWRSCARGWTSEESPTAYLDGRTRDRQARVDRFQNDPTASVVLLISLKAGGLGLNLTAADYVFQLDPWWNPAVESQATDRAHRIGQTSRCSPTGSSRGIRSRKRCSSSRSTSARWSSR